MKRFLKGILSLVLCMSVLSVVLALTVFAGAETPVASVATLEAGVTKLAEAFPDATFRNCIVNILDINGKVNNPDYLLTAENIAAIKAATTLDVGKNDTVSYRDGTIASLAGVEHFTALTSLHCYGNQLTELHVTPLVNLISLNCSYNKLTELNVAPLITLEALNCSNNQLTELNAAPVNLNDLVCSNNQLTKLNVAPLTKLTRFYCHTNKLTELNVAPLTNLKKLECQNNKLTELNVAPLVNLTELYCGNNQLTELVVAPLVNLTKLYCHVNQLTELDVAPLTQLTILECGANQLTELTVAPLVNLIGLYCTNNQLTELDVAPLVNLTTLSCHTNKLTALDVAPLTELKTLECSSNQLMELNVAPLTQLTKLYCYTNQLTKLDVAPLIQLGILNCSYNQLTELNVTTLTSLKTLDCRYNRLQGTLDLSGLTLLTVVHASANNLDTLVIPAAAKPNITVLNCRNTNIDTMDLSGFTSLSVLNVTKFTNADLSKVTNLIISGSRGPDDRSLTRLIGAAGDFSQDPTTGYITLKSGGGVKYGYSTAYPNDPSLWLDETRDNYHLLSEGGLADSEGNIIVGAALSDVQADGSILLSNGGVIVTPTGKTTFEGNVSIKDGVIKTSAPFTTTHNTIVKDANGNDIPSAENTANKIIPNGEAVADTTENRVTVPAGSQIVDDRADSSTKGDVTIVTKDTPLDTADNKLDTAGQDVIQVPADKADEIVKNDDGTLTVPEGSTIVRGDGTTETVGKGTVIGNGQITLPQPPADEVPPPTGDRSMAGLLGLTLLISAAGCLLLKRRTF